MPDRLKAPDPDAFVKAAIGETTTDVEPEQAKTWLTPCPNSTGLPELREMFPASVLWTKRLLDVTAKISAATLSKRFVERGSSTIGSS